MPLPPRPSFFVIERVKIIHRKGINLITVTRDLCAAAKWTRSMIGPCCGYLSRLSQHEWSYPDKSTSRLCPFVNRPKYPGVVIKTPDQYLVVPPLQCSPLSSAFDSFHHHHHHPTDGCMCYLPRYPQVADGSALW